MAFYTRQSWIEEGERAKGRAGESRKERAVGVTGSRFVNGHCIRARQCAVDDAATPCRRRRRFRRCKWHGTPLKPLKADARYLPDALGPPRTFLPSSLGLKRNVDASSHSSRCAMNNERRCTYALHLSRFPGTAPPPPFSTCVNEHPSAPRIPLPIIAPRSIRAPGSTTERNGPPLRLFQRENREKVAENLEISPFPSCDSCERVGNRIASKRSLLFPTSCIVLR